MFYLLCPTVLSTFSGMEADVPYSVNIKVDGVTDTELCTSNADLCKVRVRLPNSVFLSANHTPTPWKLCCLLNDVLDSFHIKNLSNFYSRFIGA